MQDLSSIFLPVSEPFNLLEFIGLYKSDIKLPDCVSVVPLKCGKVLVWDAVCAHTLTPSHQACTD